MPLPLPNLDDRTFTDLVAEMRALIPRYAPIWTDHNESDPGMTLIELFAWLTETIIYRLNRIPTASEARFLELLGVLFTPVQPARFSLRLTAIGINKEVIIPARTRLHGVSDPEFEKLRFETLYDLRLSPEEPSAVVLIQQVDYTSNEVIGISNGRPHLLLGFQQQYLHLEPSSAGIISPVVKVNDIPWTYKHNLLDSLPGDTHFTLEPRINAVRFGDGVYGMVPPVGAEIKANYLFSQGKLLRAPNASHLSFSDDLEFRIRIDEATVVSLGSNPLSIDKARELAITDLKTRWRVVTTNDFEEVVLNQKEFNLSRVKCLPEVNLDESDLSVPAPGHVSLIIVPADKLVPNHLEIQQVWEFLNVRRLLTCRHHVVGPEYTDVRVKARIVRGHQFDPFRLEKQIGLNLKAFFDPRTGGPGPERKGWPFGRDVYAAEIYQVIEETEGVDHVESLGLLTRDEASGWVDPADLVSISANHLVNFVMEQKDIIIQELT